MGDGQGRSAVFVGQQQWPRKASALERSDALGQALHASKSFLGDQWTKRQLGEDDAAG